MKWLWRVLVLAGVAVLIAALLMDTSVQGFGRRVHNTGLQQDRLLVFLLGIFLVGIGMVIFAVAKQNRTPTYEAAKEADRNQVPAGTHNMSTLVGAFRDRPQARFLGAVLLGSVVWPVSELILGGPLLALSALVPAFWPTPALTVLHYLYRVALWATVAQCLIFVFLTVSHYVPPFSLGEGLLFTLPELLVGVVVIVLAYFGTRWVKSKRAEAS